MLKYYELKILIIGYYVTQIQYYMQKANCKFGPACKYHHPIQGTGSSSPATTTTYPIQPKQGMGFGSYTPVALNVLGYPLRPVSTYILLNPYTPILQIVNFLFLFFAQGEKECVYYMRNAYCKFGPACKYHHPIQGTGSSSPATTTTYPIQPKQGMGFGSYTPVALNVLGYPLRPVSTYILLNPYTPILQIVNFLFLFFAQGEKECSYYVKTGQCKFGDTCKFHHPQTTTIVPSTAPAPAPAVSSGQLFPMHSAIYQNVQLPVIFSQPYG